MQSINSKLKLLLVFLTIFQIQQPVDCFLSQLAARLPLPGTPSPPGTPWPLPQIWEKMEDIATLSSKEGFQYFPNVDNCDILNSAVERYNYNFLTQNMPLVTEKPDLPILSSVYIQISENPTENLCSSYPKLEKEDEAYELYNISIEVSLTDDKVVIGNITAKTVWGALRGLETFSQLIWRDRDWNLNHFYLNLTQISDWPRYPHRGLMIDTARHFLPPKVIEEILDAMSYNKLNVLHWHIIDDQSFPFVSQTFPELSEQGAYIPGVLIYNPETVQNIISIARLRGIRVVLEFDTPGHTLVFGKSHLELLTPCYGDGVNPGTPDYPNFAAYEILDPTKETTYTFMRDFFTEIFQNVTKDEYVHLGMDEVYYNCWKSSPEITQFMNDHNYTEYYQVQEHYTKRHLDMIGTLGKAIIWADPLEHGVELNKDVIVQVWKSEDANGSTWHDFLQNALNLGYSTLLSSCWYLNYISYGESWRNYYECDPELSLPNPLPDWQSKLILGGEAAIWGEYVDSTNVVARLFPFVGAVAEKLWSFPVMPNKNATDDAMWRLDEHRCRLLGRGIHSQPIFNGYCGQELEYSYN